MRRSAWWLQKPPRSPAIVSDILAAAERVVDGRNADLPQRRPERAGRCNGINPRRRAVRAAGAAAYADTGGLADLARHARTPLAIAKVLTRAGLGGQRACAQCRQRLRSRRASSVRQAR
jgi:hypothetical protein